MKKNMITTICTCASICCFNQSEANTWNRIQENINAGNYYGMEVHLPKAIEESGDNITDRDITEVVLKTQNKGSTFLAGELLKDNRVAERLDPGLLPEIMRGQVSNLSNGVIPALLLADEYIINRLKHEDLVELVHILIKNRNRRLFSSFLHQDRVVNFFTEDELSNFILLLIKEMELETKEYVGDVYNSDEEEEEIRDYVSSEFALSSILKKEKIIRSVIHYEQKNNTNIISKALQRYGSKNTNSRLNQYREFLEKIKELDQPSDSESPDDIKIQELCRLFWDVTNRNYILLAEDVFAIIPENKRSKLTVPLDKGWSAAFKKFTQNSRESAVAEYMVQVLEQGVGSTNRNFSLSHLQEFDKDFWSDKKRSFIATLVEYGAPASLIKTVLLNIYEPHFSESDGRTATDVAILKDRAELVHEFKNRGIPLTPYAVFAAASSNNADNLIRWLQEHHRGLARPHHFRYFIEVTERKMELAKIKKDQNELVYQTPVLNNLYKYFLYESLAETKKEKSLTKINKEEIETYLKNLKKEKELIQEYLKSAEEGSTKITTEQAIKSQERLEQIEEDIEYVDTYKREKF